MTTKLRPEAAFINDEGKVMVADNPDEPNVVVEYVPKSTARELRDVLMALLRASDHTFAASTFRTGKWRHMGCSRCALEEKADKLIKETRGRV